MDRHGEYVAKKKAPKSEDKFPFPFPFQFQLEDIPVSVGRSDGPGQEQNINTTQSELPLSPADRMGSLDSRDIDIRVPALVWQKIKLRFQILLGTYIQLASFCPGPLPHGNLDCQLKVSQKHWRPPHGTHCSRSTMSTHVNSRPVQYTFVRGIFSSSAFQQSVRPSVCLSVCHIDPISSWAFHPVSCPIHAARNKIICNPPLKCDIMGSNAFR
ncbi:hypothetical protein MPTK1_5g18550 [Marchantia polymorpha subsp. ruderalis]|uniref:Uncharacterized protein n=2 Tax=Marchantia polymorpha TaxID=3197 RepID=A0AAF6BJS0_MARPO|nr:hypothetical protein MARPO_0073s0085 [Marchantia polymorpha]BBN12254.1 hypothetical protein Mp_5g18550 [Marchantia polymorpha subsp. ruderalis]|eukprot:PTQ35221.1 hypothetical protein MARPO_0073s0085 [Marchantia polymorpha]